MSASPPTDNPGILQRWWSLIINPADGAAFILNPGRSDGLTKHLLVLSVVLYACYGFSMGVFRGVFPGVVSAIKFPMLMLGALAICMPAFYVLNGISGPGLGARSCLRLLLLSVTANAAALASYGPVSLLVALTTSEAGYGYIVLMHVAVLAVTTLLSLVVIQIIFNEVAAARRKPRSFEFVVAWAMLYGVVGTQLSWLLRPFIGSYDVPYRPLRPMEGSFVDSVLSLLKGL